MRRSWPASPCHGCLVALTGARSSQSMPRLPCPNPALPRPQEPARRADCRAYLADASLLGSLWGQTDVSPLPCVAMARGRPVPQVCVERPPGAAPEPRTPLPSGPRVFRGPACSPGSADTATGLLCLHTGPAPTGAQGWGGTLVGRKRSPGDIRDGEMGTLRGGDNGERGRTEWRLSESGAGPWGDRSTE